MVASSEYRILLDGNVIRLYHLTKSVDVGSIKLWLRTEPCGTPYLTMTDLDVTSSMPTSDGVPIFFICRSLSLVKVREISLIIYTFIHSTVYFTNSSLYLFLIMMIYFLQVYYF